MPVNSRAHFMTRIIILEKVKKIIPFFISLQALVYVVNCLLKSIPFSFWVVCASCMKEYQYPPLVNLSSFILGLA